MNVRGALEYRAVWQRFLAIACVFALLFNNVMLIAAAEEQPMQTVLVCNKEEHTHTSDCYREEIICGLEEEPPEYRFVGVFKTHMHTPECFDKDGNVICGYVENAYVHIHNDYCYDKSGKLCCGLNEVYPHTHNKDCYDEDGILTCTKPDASHKHTVACYDSKGKLICGQQEVIEFVTKKTDWMATGHTHTDSCYANVLKCNKEEHTHTDACYEQIPVQAEPVAEPEPEIQNNEETENQEAPGAPETVDETPAEEEPQVENGEPSADDPQEAPNNEELANDPSDSTENNINNPDEVEEDIDLDNEPAEEQESENQENEPDNTPPAVEQPAEDDTVADVPDEEPADTDNTVNEETPADDTVGTEEEPSADETNENAPGEGETPAEETPAVPDAPAEDTPAEQEHSEGEVAENNTPADGENPVEGEIPAGEEPVGEETGTDVVEDTVIEENIDLTDDSDEDLPVDEDPSAEEPAGEEPADVEPVEEEPTAPEVVYELTSEDGYIVRVQGEEPNGFLAGTQINVLEGTQEVIAPSTLRVLPADATGKITVYRRMLEITLQYENEIISVNTDAKYKVAIELPDLHGITAVQVYRGEELLNSTANNRGVVTFYTNDFGVFTFVAEASETNTKDTDYMSTALYGETDYVHINVGKAPKGLTVLDSIGAEINANAWIRIHVANLPEMADGATLSLYSVEDGHLDALLRENMSADETLLISLGKYTGFALVMDCGFSQRTETAGDVTLYGMLPNAGVLTITDVCEGYAGFAPVPGRNTETLAAYDITFDGNGVELQPTGTVKVTIQNAPAAEAILQGRDVRLWHIEDDGTFTEIPDFGKGDNGEVIFYAKGFSVYALTATIDRYTGNYEFSLVGDGCVLISDLLDSLGLNIETLYASLDGEYPTLGMPEVSNTEALDVSPVTDDSGVQVNWMLRRIAPFDTQEGVSIPVSNGDTIAVMLTDEPVKQVVMEAEGDIYHVTAVFDQRAQIPEGAVLVVRDASGEGYEQAAEEAMALEDGEEVMYSRTLDISFVFEGEEIEPQAEVQIAVELIDLTEGLDSLKVYHHKEDGEEEVEINNINNNEISFASDTFSRYTFTTVLKTVAEEETENARIRLMTYSGEEEIALEQADAELEEGLELVQAVSVKGATEETPLYVKAEWTASAEPMETLYLSNLDNTSEVLTAESGSVLPLDASDIAIVKDTGYRRQELTAVVNESEILLSGMLPKDSSAEATDVTETIDNTSYEVEEETGTDVPDKTRTTIAAFDISITPSEEFAEIIGEKYEPDAEHPVHVEIADARITGLAAYELWHIKDNGERERVENFEVENGKIVFDAEEFSIYTIAEVEIRDGNKAQTINDLRQGVGFKISITGSSSGTFYALNETNTRQAGHVLISQTKDASAATEWFFQENQNGTWSIYWVDANQTKQYIHIDQQYPTKFSFSSTSPAEFYIDLYNNTPGGFYIYQSPNYSFNLKGNGTKNGFQLYPADNGTNQGSCVELVYTTSQQDLLVDLLDGQTYGLIALRTTESSITGYAVMADNANNANLRKAEQMLVRTDPTDKVSKLYVANDIRVTFWTFTHEHDGLFSLSTKIDGVTYYLRADTGNKLTITSTLDSNCEFRVIPGSGDYYGRLKLYNPTAGVAVRMGVNTTSTGTTITGFGTHATEISDNTFLYLVERSEYGDEDFVSYSAEKISVSDENLHTGSQIVIYTRVWDGSRYEFFVVDHDGSLIRAYEDGGNLTWVGRYINTALWDFTEYYYEGTNEPNYYYELQNTYSGKYIAPQVNNGQLFSNHTVGINLNGRRYGDYYTKILAWDDPNYDYAGFKADLQAAKILSVPMSQAEDFYFAVVQNNDQLTPVETISHANYGITMKLVDFSARSVPDSYLGYMDTSGKKAKTGLLSTDLTNGYPTATYSGNSFASLFSGGYTVDNLFIKNTYYGSGYFQFDSTQNFASLNDDNKTFTVYKELGTIDLPTVPRPTVDHGQFMPFNKIYPNRFAINHPYNTTDVYANPLSGDNGRTGEKLYKITADEANYYFGVEMSAGFMQLPDGKDAWGHDIIFEFTGDDDFWLYVDGELVLDLGGVHSAIGGSINFSTGVVILPPAVGGSSTTTTTSLYNIFRDNYMTRNPNATTAEVNAYLAEKFVLKNGNYIFRNYSTHSMRMFYMERGAGASNLKLRFNLTTARPGQVELEKAVTGTDKNDYASVEFPFQIYYELNDGLGCTHMVTQELLDDDVFRVVYKNSSEGVTFRQSETIDGVTYNNVFMLKPGQIADITMPTNTMDYKIRECGVNMNIYDDTTVNGETPSAEGQGNSHTKWFESSIDTPEDRVKVVFENHVDPSALRTLSVTKLLYDENDVLLTAQQDPTGFRFRVYLGDDLDYYRMGEYHVKDPNGNYCIYNNGFVSTGIANFDSLTDEQKTRATFKTSPSGAVDKIPSQYTVEIRNLLVGTKFKIEERISDLPKGYSYRTFTVEEGGVPVEYVCYRRVEGSYILEQGYTVNSGIIRDNSDPALEIHNRRGWGLTGTKTWSDRDFMEEHGAIYFAVAVGNTMLPGTLRQVPANGSLYYYFGSLEQGYTFSDYKIREVSVTGTSENPIVVDEDGYVTGYATATLLDTDDIVEVNNCKLSSSSQYVMLPYSVSYETGSMNGVSGHENIREDRVINERPDGLRFMKTDWDGNPLEGATFTLKKDNDVIGTYDSDSRGWITTAYLADGNYTLDEIVSPVGYQGLQDTIAFTIQGTTVTVTSSNAQWVTVERPLHGLVTIYVKNRPVSFKVYKKDPQNTPLAGAHFALYKQRVSYNGQLVKDFAPMEGYEDIVSQADGELPGINETLPKGVYYLTEEEAPDTYVLLSSDLLFEIDELGYINKISGPGTMTQSEQQSGSMTVYYTISVENEHRITDGILIRKIVTGDLGDRQLDFVFTLTQAPSGMSFEWKKNGVTQGTQLSQGSTFTLKHNDTVQIYVPDNTLVRISEANGYYNTTWDFNGDTLTADANNSVGISDVGILTVTNDLGTVAPTGFVNTTAVFSILLVIGIGLWIFTRKCSKNHQNN